MSSQDCYLLAPLAMAGSPVQWVILALVVVAIFAPKLLPLIGRMAGLEARRRVGLPAPRSTAGDERRPIPSAEEPPEPPSPVVIATGLQRPRGVSPWLMACLVAAAVAVLSWFMLRS